MLEISPERDVYCNRTLNFRSIKAIGYDMDYTLIHYKVEEWERRAYQYVKDRFIAAGWPVAHLEFDPAMVSRGLIIDLERGNLVKANRFGFVKKAMHGTKPADFDLQREAYSRTIVDLAEKRWVFLNTLFSLSEGCFYAQLVDLLDERKVPEVLGYADLYYRIKDVLDFTHMEGRLKADIIGNPEKYVSLDPEIPLALLDQKHSGKKLMLITNSEWPYSQAMMSFCFDRFLPKGMSWRELFDVVIVGARKPAFFTTFSPFFEVVDEAKGYLAPSTQSGLKPKVAYHGGSAREVERHLGISGDQILYVGDHIFGDVHVTKNILRWRTALVLRELEDELRALVAFRPSEITLAAKMREKEKLEARIALIRVELQRKRNGYGPPSDVDETELDARYEDLKEQLIELDQEIAPLAKASGELSNPHWGLLMRAGNDKSYLAYQLERYADIYMSRVSNFLMASPFAYLRSRRGSLPHDHAND